MTAYDHTLTLRIPASLYDTACAIARSLDPDTGGAQSFGPRNPLDANGTPTTPSEYSTTTSCTGEFYAQAHAMMLDASLLYSVVSADYAVRWHDLTPPTLAECQAFVAGAVIVGPPEPAP
jgi:hypothetical protein